MNRAKRQLHADARVLAYTFALGAVVAIPFNPVATAALAASAVAILRLAVQLR